jgi:hypothetical protein
LNDCVVLFLTSTVPRFSQFDADLFRGNAIENVVGITITKTATKNLNNFI